jgi:serine/threonine protein kinase
MKDDAHIRHIRAAVSRVLRRENLATTSPRMQRVEQLFVAALDLPTAQRTSFLDQECRGDDELRRELNDLLAAERQSSMGLPEPSRMNLIGLGEFQPGCPTTVWTEAAHGRGVASEDDSPRPGLSTGSRLGQYELIRLLGCGGMGEVHLARDLRLGRLVAVKRLSAHGAGLTERFLSEARTTARCMHENIVVIHEVGEHNGHPYMVLEYLEGQTLRQWLREHARGSGEHAPVPPGRAVELMLPVVRALAYAHERGIVHRDLKPENVMLTRSGTIKVLDFGIAKLLSAPRPDGEVSDGIPDGVLNPMSGRVSAPVAVHCSALIGTLPYMSPEQMNVGVIDHRSDIWAVGIMLFELVTGRHPILTYSMRNLMRIADRDEPMPSVGETMPGLGPLAGIIDRCLLKRLEHRTPSARSLLAELESLAPGRRTVLMGSDGSPFAGLAAFQEADADRFFGRDRDIEQIVTELRSRPLVAVVGPSGTGKSSLVRAGIIPALKRSGEGWDAYIVRPGREPLATLAGILAQDHGSANNPGRSNGDVSDTASTVLGPLIERMRAEPGYLGARLRARATSKLRRILVFVDQLEELYTLGAPPDERSAFLTCLAAVADDAISPLRVVVSMRSDFLDRMAEDRGFGTEITRGLVLLPPMDRDGMCAALLRPVEAAEHRFESLALVDRMVEALVAAPGALPLLQFTATRLWDLRDTGRRLLTEASYERLGGVAGALATHADAVLAGMSSAQQVLARAVLERLVTPERTRALVSVTELRALYRDAGAVDHVIQHLAAMRLLVIESGAEGADHAVELVHESLIDRWPTLARWLAENQEDAAFLARLRSAAQEWEKRSRDEGLLWRGAPASEARLWYAHYHGALARREQEYLVAVFALADRAVRMRRRIVGGSMAVMALLLVGTTVALIQIRQAQREADRQAKIARAQADEREQARRDAEKAWQEAAQQARVARAQAEAAAQAQKVAETERARAEQETRKASAALAQARQSETQARQSETRARQAEADALAARDRAEAAAAAERHMRQELQDFLDRALGHMTDSMPVPAPSSVPSFTSNQENPMQHLHPARAGTLLGLTLLDLSGAAQAQQRVVPEPPEVTQQPAAQPPLSLIAALFAEGTALFKQWRFDEAEQKFRAALTHGEHPIIHLYLSRALEKQGRLVEAHTSLQQSRRADPEALLPEDVQVAEELQKSLESRLAQIEVSCDVPGAQVSLDGEPLFTAPGRQRRMMNAGQHVLIARKPGYFPVTEPVSLIPGKQTRVVLRMTADVVHIERRWQPWQPWTVVGAGITASLAGGLFFWQARRDYEAFQNALDSCEHPRPCDQRSIQRYDSGVRNEHLGIGALIVGGTALATGLVGVLINQPRTWRSEPAGDVKGLNLAPIVSGDVLGISTRIRF